MADEKKIWLTIKGTQMNPDGETNDIELMTEGTICREGDKTVLTYTESEIVGTDGSTLTIELAGKAVSILRSGGYGMNFEFIEGRPCLTLYSTPFGVMEMKAVPTTVRYNIGDTGGDIDIRYDLEIRGQSIGSNHLRMRWREDEA